jgi:hypothetical protein
VPLEVSISTPPYVAVAPPALLLTVCASTGFISIAVPLVATRVVKVIVAIASIATLILFDVLIIYKKQIGDSIIKL